MTLTYILLFPFILLSVKNQQNSPVHFQKEGIEGSIFHANYVPNLKSYSSESLSIEVDYVLIVDSLAHKYILNKASKNPHLMGGGGGCPRILNSWQDYYRQIVSYREKQSGHEIIYIRYIYKKEAEIYFPNWASQWVSISGGCTNYFSIVYDKTKKKIIQFGIN